MKNFIKNIHNIYPPKELRIYSQRYPQEYNSFNDGLMLGMLATSWCMPPPVMVINNNPYGYGMGYNDYGYNNNYNNYNPPQNAYDGNPNPDSAIGGFQPNNNNIEMTEINNNNNINSGGNFGGNGNNNTGGSFGGFGNSNNDMGDFGGGDVGDF